MKDLKTGHCLLYNSHGKKYFTYFVCFKRELTKLFKMYNSVPSKLSTYVQWMRNTYSEIYIFTMYIPVLIILKLDST